MHGTYLILPIAVYLLICVIWAFFRGASRSKFRLIMVFLSAIAAYVGTLLIKTSASSHIVLEKLSRLAAESGFDILNQIAQYSPSLSELLLSSATALTAPLIFLGLFIALTVVTWIIYFVITLILFPLFHRSEKKKAFRKLRASINGLLQGVIVVIAFMIPICCYLELTPAVIDKIEETTSYTKVLLPDQTIVTLEECKDDIDQINSSLTVKTFRNLGGGWLYENLTDFSVVVGDSREKVKLTDEVGALFDFAYSIGGLSSKDITHYTAKEAELILNLGQSFADSKLLPALTSELLYNLTEAWKNGEAFATLEKPSMGEMFDPMFNDMIVIFNESSRDREKLSEDIISVSKLAAKLAEYQVFAKIGDDDALSALLTEGNAVAELSDILSENERMKVIVKDINDLAVILLARSFGVPEENTEVYNEMLASIADTITSSRETPPEERKEIIKDTVSAELEKAGISVESEYIDRLATVFVEDFSDFDGEITPAFIAEFYKLYTSMQNQ